MNLLFFLHKIELKLWDKDLKFGRQLLVHQNEGERFAVLALTANDHKQLYSSARDGTLRFFRRPWSHDHCDTMLQTVMDDVTALTHSRNTNTLYSGDDKGIVTKWYHNQVGCQYNVIEEVKGLAVEGAHNQQKFTKMWKWKSSFFSFSDRKSQALIYTLHAKLMLLLPISNRV